MTSGIQPSPHIPLTFAAAADYSAADAGRYRLGTIGAGGIVTRTGDGARAHCVMQEDKAQGEPVPCYLGGVLLVRVGTGGVTAGEQVSSDANGQVVSPASADELVGITLDTAAAGALARVFLLHDGVEP